MTDAPVRDSREPRHFWADNEVADVYLEQIGTYGFAVYMLLCRYANSDTAQCDPSIETLAKKLGVSTPTIKKALNKLKDAGLIAVEQRTVERNGKKEHLTNLYTLLKVKGRCQDPVSNDVTQVGNHVTQGSRESGQPDYPGVGNHVTPNNTNGNKTKDSLSEKPPASSKPKPEPKPWSALTKAMHDATPIEVRPIKCFYPKHDKDAEECFKAGVTGELVTAFVKDAYEHDPWIRGEKPGQDGRPVVMYMGYVCQNINAWKAKSTLHNGSKTDDQYVLIDDPDFPGTNIKKRVHRDYLYLYQGGVK